MNVAQMLELQLIDSAIDQLSHRRARLPELAVKAAAAQAIFDLEREIAEAERAAVDALAVISQSERQSEDLTNKRLRLEQQLKTVISPREAEALMHEIEHLNAQRGELDDAELVALDAQSVAERSIADLDARRAPLQADLHDAEQALGLVQGALDAEHQELGVRRNEAAAALAPEGLVVYDRARVQFAGVAVARLDGLRCQGCHLDMSRGEADALRSLPVDELPECPQCGRFLVR